MERKRLSENVTQFVLQNYNLKCQQNRSCVCHNPYQIDQYIYTTYFQARSQNCESDYSLRHTCLSVSLFVRLSVRMEQLVSL